MAATNQTVTVQPGGTLTLRGADGQTTTVAVQAAPPPVVKNDVPGPSWTPVVVTALITATVTLFAAWLGQWLAHRNTSQRERRGKRADVYERIVETAGEIDAALGLLVAAYETRHMRNGMDAMIRYGSAKSRLDAYVTSYIARFGQEDPTSIALHKLEAPLASADPDQPLLSGNRRRDGPIIRRRRAEFEKQVEAVVASALEW